MKSQLFTKRSIPYILINNNNFDFNNYSNENNNINNFYEDYETDSTISDESIEEDLYLSINSNDNDTDNETDKDYKTDSIIFDKSIDKNQNQNQNKNKDKNKSRNRNENRGRSRIRVRSRGRGRGRGRGRSKGKSKDRNKNIDDDNNNNKLPLPPEFTKFEYIEPEHLAKVTLPYPLNELENFISFDIFSLFFPEYILNTIIKNTNDYAILNNKNDHGRKWNHLTLSDLYIWLGIIIYSGIFKTSSFQDYWNTSLQFPKHSFTLYMSQIRFE